MMQAVGVNGSCLEWGSDEIKANEDIVYESLARHPRALEYASEGLQGDASFIVDAVQSNVMVLKYVAPEFLANPEVDARSGYVHQIHRM